MLFQSKSSWSSVLISDKVRLRARSSFLFFDFLCLGDSGFSNLMFIPPSILSFVVVISFMADSLAKSWSTLLISSLAGSPASLTESSLANISAGSLRSADGFIEWKLLVESIGLETEYFPAFRVFAFDEAVGIGMLLFVKVSIAVLSTGDGVTLLGDVGVPLLGGVGVTLLGDAGVTLLGDGVVTIGISSFDIVPFILLMGYANLAPR